MNQFGEILIFVALCFFAIALIINYGERNKLKSRIENLEMRMNEIHHIDNKPLPLP